MTNKFFQLKSILALAVIALSFSSCLKSNDATFTDFSQAGSNVTLMTTTSNAPGILYTTGTGNFSLGNIIPSSADSIDLDLVAQLNSEYPLSSDVNVTLAPDDSKRTAYNASTTPAGVFQLMTPAMYKILSTSLTIKAGQRLARTFVRIYSAPILAQSPSISWLLPVTLTTSGTTAASNSSTLYVNVIGNVLAGKYSYRYRRFQVADTTGTPLQDLTNIVTCLPVSSSIINAPETYTQSFVNTSTGGIQVQFTNTAGVLSNFTTSLNAKTIADIPIGGFVLLDGPKFTGGGVVVVGTPATNYIGTKFSTYIQYLNSAGGTRTLIGDFIKIP